MQMHGGSEDVGPEDTGDGGAAGDGAGLSLLVSPQPLPGAGIIRTLMRTMIVVGSGTDTSGRTSATSPMLGIDAELGEPVGYGLASGAAQSVAHAKLGRTCRLITSLQTDKSLPSRFCAARFTPRPASRNPMLAVHFVGNAPPSRRVHTGSILILRSHVMPGASDSRSSSSASPSVTKIIDRPHPNRPCHRARPARPCPMPRPCRRQSATECHRQYQSGT